MAISFLLSTCLIFDCASTDTVKYLTAAEVRAFIIGKTLKEADSGAWKEHYVPDGSDRSTGTIRGRSKNSPPYSGTWSMDGNLMCVRYPSLPDQGGCFRFSKGEKSKILWFDEAGNLAFESELIESGESGNIASESTSRVLQQETVKFQHDENSLVGTLTLPPGPKPYPAILFVHGSGPTTRHWSYYESMRDEFVSRGFATLIWSKPGVDESTGDYLTQSMGHRAEEVVAAMAHIAERPDIDASRIGLWGGSQAGWVVPIVAATRDVAFMIMMSCPAQSALNQTLYLDGNLLASTELSEADKADALAQIRASYELIRKSRSYEDFLRGQELLLADVKERSWYSDIRRQPFYSQLSWFLPRERSMYQYLRLVFVNDAPPKLENLQPPLLAIYGTNDIQVDWKLGSTAYEEIPRAAGNSDVTVRLFDGADHTLMQPDSDGYKYYAPGLLATMGEWLAKQR